MTRRIMALAGGIAGAVCLSQYPEFSQQYLQRLGGQVDALAAITADFDAAASASNLTRDAAFDQLQGTDFLAARQRDMRATFQRHDRLSRDLQFLRLATPIERLLLPQRLADPALVQSTWADFRPAVPVSVEGAAASAFGFVAGLIAVKSVIALILWPFARKKRHKSVRAAQIMRPEPPLRNARPSVLRA